MDYKIYIIAIFTMIISVLLGERLSKKLSENEDRKIEDFNIHPLNKDRFFLTVIFCSLFLSIDILVIIFLESLFSGRYIIGLSGESFLRAFDLFKAPISILGAGFAVAALIATIHRSRETNIQIHKTNQQIQKADQKNTFENYIKHRDEIIKELEIFDDAFLVKKLEMKAIIYSRIYKDNFYSKMSYLISKEDNDKYINYLDSFEFIFKNKANTDKIYYSISIYGRMISLFNVKFTAQVEVEIHGDTYRFPSKKDFSNNINENKEVLINAIYNGLALSSALLYRTIVTGGGKGEYRPELNINDIFKDNIETLINSEKHDVKYKR